MTCLTRIADRIVTSERSLSHTLDPLSHPFSPLSLSLSFLISHTCIFLYIHVYTLYFECTFLVKYINFLARGKGDLEIWVIWCTLRVHIAQSLLTRAITYGLSSFLDIFRNFSIS